MEKQSIIDVETAAFSVLKFDHILMACAISIFFAVLPVQPNEKKTIISMFFPILYLLNIPI